MAKIPESDLSIKVYESTAPSTFHYKAMRLLHLPSGIEVHHVLSPLETYVEAKVILLKELKRQLPGLDSTH